MLSARIDRRLEKHQKPGKRCVFVMRQKCAEIAESKSVGAHHTLTFFLKYQNQADVMRPAGCFVSAGSTICADEANA